MDNKIQKNYYTAEDYYNAYSKLLDAINLMLNQADILYYGATGIDVREEEVLDKNKDVNNDDRLTKFKKSLDFFERKTDDLTDPSGALTPNEFNEGMNAIQDLIQTMRMNVTNIANKECE